jgi:branched-chain amino acid transport system ATP-binding protein
MKAIFGLLKVRGGSITVDGTDITGWVPNRIVEAGVCYVPQVSNVFREMTVHENLEMGAFLRSGDLSAAYDRVYTLFPDLKERRKALAGNLSGGQRQMVAMGRALMLEPKLLLLDEPTAGLSPRYMEQIFQICRDVRDTGVTIVLVEQHAKQALAFADRGYVLASGANRHEGTGADLLADRDVADMFLGG